MRQTVDTPFGLWCWHRFGSGSEHIIALHGYGLSGLVFGEFAEKLGPGYTVWAPDLPGHGDEPLPSEVLSAFVELFQYLPEDISDTFLLLGHSWGGPLSLSLCPTLQPRLKGLLLYAPSYLLVPFPLGFMDWPFWLKKAGAWGIRYPGWIKAFSAIMHRLGWTTKFNYNFTRTLLSSEKERNLLIACWWYWPVESKRILRRLLAEKAVPVQLVLGKKDKVLAYHRMEQGTIAYPDLSVVVLEAGHYPPAAGLAEIIAHFLQNPAPASPRPSKT